MRGLLFISLLLVGWSLKAQNMAPLVDSFVREYRALQIPDISYDYREYLQSLSAGKPREDSVFFAEWKTRLLRYNRQGLGSEDRINYDHILYITEMELGRVDVVARWMRGGKKIVSGGLYGLENGKDWYRYLVKRYTTISITPEEIFALGESEVRRVKMEIEQLKMQLGFRDSASFYSHLNSDTFFISDKEELIRAFERVDDKVRKQLPDFAGMDAVPEVYAMEWPGATALTPPGMYLNRSDNAYGKDVFQFNFYNNRFNRRAIEWLYMHEAIPGHHLQASVARPSSKLEELFLYPGNFEGWACYVEYFGKELGLYSDPYSYLGKWEWDLVRSARLVLDAGIHYYGWTREQALSYWKQTIPNQNDIAEREVTRVTNWPAQALSYKVGARQVFKMQEAWEKQHPDKARSTFYKAFLEMGRLPLRVIEQNLS